MSRSTVLIVEDHPEIRAIVQDLLSDELEVVGTVERGDEVLAAAVRLAPDVVVLDISLPGISGLLVLPQLRAQLPNAAVVILTIHNDALYREEAFRCGADAYVLKARAGAELLSTIKDVLSAPQLQSRPT